MGEVFESEIQLMVGQKDQPIPGKKIYIVSYDLAARLVY